MVTKGGLVWDEASRVLGHDSSRRHLEEGLDASLRRLGTDYVDLFLIHWPDLATPITETMAVLEEIVRAGKARYVGVSNFTDEQVRTAAEALRSVPLAANQVGFHLFDRRWAHDAFPTCWGLGVGVMAYGSLAHGLLAGEFTRETTFDPSDWRAAGTLFGQELLTLGNFERNLDVVDRLKVVADRRGITLPQLAVGWVLADPVVTVALVGARNEREVSEAAGAADLDLAADDLEEIESIMTNAAGTSTLLPA